MLKKDKFKVIRTFFIVVILVAAFLIIDTNCISTGRYTTGNKDLPEAFDGFKIVEVADLHNKGFGIDQNYLMYKIKKENPDIIVVTGDLVDRRKWGTKNAMLFIDKAVEVAPVYFVSGNHEVWSGKYDYIKDLLLEKGVIVLDDETRVIKKGNDKISISGIIDTGFEDREDYADKIIEEVSIEAKEKADYNILLSHRPEHMDDYVNSDFDLVFSGHAHGGQFRIPFVGGVYAPHQGFMPKYTGGIYKEENTEMILSRGLGNSTIPVRIFNMPEITVTKLEN